MNFQKQKGYMDFSGAFTALIGIGIVIGILLAGAGAGIYWLFKNVTITIGG